MNVQARHLVSNLVGVVSVDRGGSGRGTWLRTPAENGVHTISQSREYFVAMHMAM